MTLSEEDAKLYYKLWFPLLDFVNKKRHINSLRGIASATSLDPTKVKEVAQSLVHVPDTIKLGQLIKDAYGTENFEDLFWDDVVNQNLDKLDLTVHPIEPSVITEIDTVEELKAIDKSYDRG